MISQHTKIILATIFSVPRNCDVATSQAAVNPYHVCSTPCTHHSRATGMMGLSFCPYLTYFTPKTHNECPVARFSIDRIHCSCIYGHLLLYPNFVRSSLENIRVPGRNQPTIAEIEFHSNVEIVQEIRTTIEVVDEFVYLGS
jgi:selenocysteine lyase/cysteine desulfurase